MYCIVRSPETGKTFGTQLALNVHIWAATLHEAAALCFNDTFRDHTIHGAVAKIEDNAISWRDQKGGIWKLREVELQEYRYRLAQSVHDGEKIAETVHTTEELWDFYRKSFT